MVMVHVIGGDIGKDIKRRLGANTLRKHCYWTLGYIVLVLALVP